MATRGITRLCVVDASAGLALLAGAITPWLRGGQGHTLRGLDLADQLLGGQLAPSWGRTVGLALYVCVATGALLLASSAFRVVWLDVARMSLSAAMLAAALVIVALGWFPIGLWGLAPFLAVVGLSVSFATNSWSLATRHVLENMSARK
jgi:hypothetical protein